MKPHIIVPLFCSLGITLSGNADNWGTSRIHATADYQSSRPQAVGFYETSQDKTYLVFGDEFMDPNILTYDHSTEEWSGLYEVGGRFHDSNYHCYPTMVKGPDGRLHVFISRGYISQSTSPGPLQLNGEWNERIMIDSGGNEISGSYPMPVTAADGSMYLFYRGSAPGSYMEPAFYQKSTDNGDTWGDPRRAVFHDPARDDSQNVCYFVIEHQPATESVSERVLIAWTNSGPGTDGKGSKNDAHKDAFFAYLALPEEQFYAADGTPLGDFINDDEAEAHCKIYDSGPLTDGRLMNVSYMFAPAMTDEGNYLIFCGTRDQDAGPNGDGLDEKGDPIHAATLFRWDGEQWHHQTLKTPMGQEPGDVAPTGPVSWAYLHVMPGDDTNIMRVFESNDDGVTWTETATLDGIERAGYIDNARPELMFQARKHRSGNAGIQIVGKPPVAHRAEPPLEVQNTSIPYGALFFDAFDDGEADGWQAQRNAWSVDTQDPRRGVRQSNGVHANNIWMSAGQSNWSDYEVSCLMEFRSTPMKFAKKEESGLLARWQDENNYYAFVIWPDEERVSIDKVVDGTRTELATAPYVASIARPIKLQAILRGDQLLFFVDGVKVLEATDDQINTGKIGLRARLVDTLFDDITVMPVSGGAAVTR